MLGGNNIPVSLNIGNQGGNGTYNLSGGTLSFNGTNTTSFVVLGRNAASNNASAQLPSTGILNLSGNGSMTPTNATLIIGSNGIGSLPGALPGSGIINQTGGTLSIDSGSQLFLSATGNGTYNLDGGALEIGGATSLFANFNNTGGTPTFNLGGGTIQVIGSPLAATVDATLMPSTISTIDTNGIGATWSGILSGGGVLAKAGDGTLTLSGSNTYSGGTIINRGTIAVNADNGLGAPTGPLTFNGGTLQFDSSFDLSPSRAIMLNAANNGFAGGGTFDTNGNASTISQGIQGAGGLTKAGDGTLTLSGPNTYTGATTVAAGTLAAGAVGTLPGMTAVTVAAPGTLDLAGFNQSIGSLAGEGAVSLGNATLTTGNDNTSTTFSGAMSGTGALDKVGAGTLILDGDNPYTGGTTVSAGTLAVGDFAHPSAALSGGGAIAVEAGATLGGYGSVIGDVTNRGVLAPGSATPGFSGSPMGAFTINGNYAGAGGTMAINTVLGGSGSPSDRLVISGGLASGSTIVHVTNVGGVGAETTGNGIPVVNAVSGATTAPGAFALPAGELRAGAFDYDLLRGGASGASANDWFLRSGFVSGGGGGGGGAPLPIPPFPIDPPPATLPPGVAFPIIGPELATYGVVQPLARQLGLSILGTLDDRVGDTYEPDGCAVAPAVAPDSLPTRKGPAPAPCPLFSPSVWGRFFGQTIDNHYQAFADPRASGNMGGFQGGIDLLRGSLIAGQYERAGLYGAFGDTSVNVNGLVTNSAATAYLLERTGSLNLNAWSVGGYWTHVGPTGWYLDTVLQGTWYGGSASTQFAKLDTNGTGFIASLEGGYPFSWPQLGPGFVIEPQGQILWQKVSFGQRNDGLGDVALGDTTGPSGRIGLRTKWTIATAGGQVWQPYLRANLWRDWGAEADTVYSGTDVVPLVSQTTMLALGGGLTGRINANVSVFANVDYEFAVGAAEGEKRNGVRGAFGAKYTW
jgi:outer membrane autotransporter protein